MDEVKNENEVKKKKERASDEQTGKPFELKPEKKRKKEWAWDEQTGKPFELEPEHWWDILAATVSILYSIAILLFFSWLLFEICTRGKASPELGLINPAWYESGLFRLIAFTVIGGGFGGVINGMRSFIGWHCERKAFGWRFVWKNISLPLLGAIMAAVVYAVIRGGIAAFGGDFNLSDVGTVQEFSAFGVGSLVGYGSHKVFRWLDAQVDKLFKITKTPPYTTKVPNLIDKTQEEAETLLKEANLELGEIEQKPEKDPNKINKIIDQNPPPDSTAPVGSSVDITVAIKA
ncbi:MAG: PASTA domain-containing protein [Candidatus Hodarchaeota archaeon]